MPDVSDGVYRASFFTSSSRSYPSNGVGDEVVMQPDREAAQRWEIRNVASTDYTIRVADTDRYLGYDGNAPSPMKAIKLSSQQRRWAFYDGPEPHTVLIGVAGRTIGSVGG